MKSQASAALGVVLIWLLTNNLEIVATVSEPDLGERSQVILVKEIQPLIGQLALAALVGSVIVWLTGGLVRKIVSTFNAAALIYLGALTVSLVTNPTAQLADSVDLSGNVVGTSVGYFSYLLAVVSFVSGLLYLGSVKTYSTDKTSRPRLKTDRDTWRDQDAGKDSTK